MRLVGPFIHHCECPVSFCLLVWQFSDQLQKFLPVFDVTVDQGVIPVRVQVHRFLTKPDLKIIAAAIRRIAGVQGLMQVASQVANPIECLLAHLRMGLLLSQYDGVFFQRFGRALPIGAVSGLAILPLALRNIHVVEWRTPFPFAGIANFIQPVAGFENGLLIEWA